MTGDPYWRVHALASAAEMEDDPPALAPAAAQEWCNFPVWEPAYLPAGWQVRQGTLRKEAPPGRAPGVTAGRTPWSTSNPAAYRFEIVDQSRRLRVKQFLYDWAFPALDHPCLWGSPTRAAPLGQGPVLWFGVDYMGNRAASARLARTLIELSVLDGEFSDDEVLQLYRSLRPASPAAAAALAATPFARLSYWARYGEATMVNVPIGLWKFRRPDSAHEGDWAGDYAGIAALLAEFRLPHELRGRTADSAARFTSPTGLSEIEASYTGGPDRGRELRLVAQRTGEGRICFPAEPEDHPATRTRVRVASTDIDLAWIDERYGPWDAMWRDPAAGVEIKLLSSTGGGQDRDWFLGAVADLISHGAAVPASSHRGGATGGMP